jgi:hypothetical protein
MPFALDSNPALSEISEAINYLLGNFGANLSADPNSGEIKGPTGNVIAYLYKYLAVKYADSADGAVNFSDSPTNRQYYGLRNTDQSTESTNPADYIWKQVVGGFGTTKFLWYQTGGGRQVEFIVDTVAPNSYFIAAPAAAIDLDVVTGNNGKMYAMPAIYIWTATSTAPTRPTTTSTYTWATGVISSVPAGWSSSVPATPSGFTYLWQIVVPLIESINQTTSVVDWTNTSYPITAIGAIGASGSTGPRTTTGYIYYQLASLTAPATPTASGFNFVSGQFSSLSANWSTNFNAPAATDTTKFWAVYYSVSEATFGGTQTVTISAPFNWTNFNGLVTFTNLSTNTGTTFIDGGNIITDTLTVDKISSGQTTAINGGYFGLGVGTLYGYTGVGRFDMQSGTRVAIAATYSNATGDGLASMFITRSPNSWGTWSSYATTDNFNAFATTAVTGGSVAGLFKYNQSITTPNNLSLPPRTIFYTGSTDWGGYGEYLGPSGTYAKTQGIVGFIDAGGAFGFFTSSGVVSKRIFNATSSYAAFAESIAGDNKIYSADGYLPFTGVHDGLYEGDIEVGDIVVDYLVVKQLDISNVVMQYQMSSSANQKGVIGVCSQLYDTPPQDWDEYFVEQGPVNTTTGESTLVTIPNPQYVPIPSGQRVINVNGLGEGLINVTGEGGDIEIGDLIVTSSTPGKGMKQSDDIVRSITVAKSRQTITFDAVDQVKTIACIYLGG